MIYFFNKRPMGLIAHMKNIVLWPKYTALPVLPVVINYQIHRTTPKRLFLTPKGYELTKQND